MGDFYEYDRDFENDAALSSSSFLTPLLNNQPRSRVKVDLNDEETIKARVEETFKRLELSKRLKPGSLIYWEADKTQTLPPLPSNWQALKHKEAGQVQYGLIQAGEAV